MRAVVDTNLIVSGLLWGGPPSKLMEAVSEGRLELLLSPDLYLELEDVLGRPKLAGRIAARGSTPPTLLSTVSAVAEIIFPEPLPLPPDLRDRDDLPVLECAVTAAADAIITGDDDLLVMGSFADVPIINARAALARLDIAAS